MITCCTTQADNFSAIANRVTSLLNYSTCSAFKISAFRAQQVIMVCQPLPKSNPMQSICPGLTARYGHNPSGKEAARLCSLRSTVRPSRYLQPVAHKFIPDAKLLCVPLVHCSKNRQYQHNAAFEPIHFSVISTTSSGKVSHLDHNPLKISCYSRPRYVPLHYISHPPNLGCSISFATLRSPSIKATSMRYSPLPLPFAGTGEYIAASASIEQVFQLLVKGQPAERNGLRLAPLCFLSHPVSSCHLLHAS